jgi:hypothetical protein
VRNVVFVWTATAHNFHQDGPLLRSYQPRRYDVVGVDGYNTGDWESAKNLFAYAHKFAVRHHKGLMIGEVGSAEDPNDATAKGRWIRNAAATFKAWRVRMVVWTNTATTGPRPPTPPPRSGRRAGCATSAGSGGHPRRRTSGASRRLMRAGSVYVSLPHRL